MSYDASYNSVISCMIACRSVTYAQKYSRLLRKYGYSAYMRRLPSDLSDAGCGYAVAVRPEQARPALALLRSYGTEPFRLYCEDCGGSFEEMIP
jgi:hypothetical protein